MAQSSYQLLILQQSGIMSQDLLNKSVEERGNAGSESIMHMLNSLFNQ